MCCCEVLHQIEGLATIVRSATPLSTRACKSPTRSLPVPAPQLGTFQPPSSCHLEAWGDSCPQFSHNQQSQCITRFFIRSVGWICCQDANSATLKTNFLSAVKNLVLLRQKKNKNLKIQIGSEQWIRKPIQNCQDAAKLQTLLELHVGCKNMTRNMVTNVMILKYLSHSLTRLGLIL